MVSSTTSLYGDVLRGMRRRFLSAGLFSAGVNLLMLVGPLYMLQIYDRVMLSGSLSTLYGLFVIVAVLYGFMALYDLMRARILSRAAFQLDEKLAPLAFATRLDKTEDSSLRDLDTVRNFMAGPALRALFDVPWLPVFLIAVFLIHPLLGALTFLGALVIVGLAVINHYVTKTPLSEAAGKDSEERTFIELCRRGTETVRALGMSQAITARWQALHRGGMVPAQTGGDRGDVFSATSRSFRLLLQAVLLTGGAYLALNQQISMGMIVGVSILAGRALAPIDQIIGQWRVIGRAYDAHSRLWAAFETEPSAAKPALDLPEIRGHLAFHQVTKLVPGGQDKGRPRILEHVSFELEPGDGLCVMGNSAAGKSSLARLAVGGWIPDAGQVRLDGATLDQWDPERLGRQIGYLPQQVELFPGTIAENIARFDPQADADAVFAATTLARVHEMILSLPDGYETRIGQGATPLSGGQLQRIGLARALYGGPKLVVLDEPNAHLDIQGDDALVETVRALCARAVTVVMMSHRPSLIQAANKMLVLNKGRVVRFGPRDEVIAAPEPGRPRSVSTPPNRPMQAVPPASGVKHGPASITAAARKAG